MDSGLYVFVTLREMVLHIYLLKQLFVFYLSAHPPFTVLRENI